MFAVLSNITDASLAETPATLLEKAATGGSVILIGLSIVFLGLISLIFITWLYPKISEKIIGFGHKIKNRKKTDNVRVSPAISANDAQPKQSSGAVTQFEKTDAVIAAITAAVALSIGTSTNGIVIKSIKRTKTNIPAWSADGRFEQILNRF